MKQLKIIVGLSLSLLLGACSSIDVDEILPDQSVAYKREKQAENNLEVPPDLTAVRMNDRMNVPDSTGVATHYSEFDTDRKLRGVENRKPGNRGEVLPENPVVQVHRDGDARWLVVNAGADAVWDRVLDFWQDQGVLLEEQDPSVGIMRTTWLDNRASISRDFVTDTIRKVFDGLYETGLRDQYRVRFERLPNNQTEVYLTHYGLKEELVTDNQQQGENTVWTPREREPDLEAIMLRRMMVFLGAADERARVQLTARKQQRASIVNMVRDRDGIAKLVMAQQFDRAWRLVGLVLDRVGFAVEDRNRQDGVYYVRYNDPAVEVESGGFLSALKFWSDDKPDKNTAYQIKVMPQANNSIVTVLNSEGELDKTDTAPRILNLIQEQLK